MRSQWMSANAGFLALDYAPSAQEFTRSLKCRWSLAAISVIVAVAPLFAGQPAPRGARVRDVTLAADNGAATVEVVNTSTKNITAYAISYDVTYADGHHEKGERIVEYLQGIISSQQRLGINWSGEGIFHSGEHRKEVMHFPSQTKGKSIVAVNAEVDVVVYMDLTADIGNREAFASLISDRASTAKVAESIASILENALADQNDAHPLRTVRLRVGQMMNSTVSPSTRAEIAGALRNFDAAQADGTMDEREYIRIALAEKNEQAVMTDKHAQIKGTP